MNDPRAAILAEALTWLDTPYHAQQGVKGVGVDCSMLLVCVAKNVGLLPHEWQCPHYSPQWHLHQDHELYKQILEEGGCTPIPLAAAIPGDILLYHFGRTASHGGIVFPERRILHAVLGQRVLLQRMTPAWDKRLVAAYTFPGVSGETNA